MKVIVGVKRVIDHSVQIRLNSNRSGVETGSVKMSINPFDEIAVEEAVRLKEAGTASEVVVVSIGPEQAKDTIRAALAMGADRGVLVTTENAVEPLAVAKILAKITVEEGAGLVLVGKQAIDDDCNQTGQMLAAMLGWPQATFASSLTVGPEAAEVIREVDGGLQTIEIKLPAVVTVDLRLNQPRYASLPNIMKARSKPMSVRPASDFGVDLTFRLTVLSVDAPRQRKAGIRVASVDELIAKLKSEAGVI